MNQPLQGEVWDLVLDINALLHFYQDSIGMVNVNQGTVPESRPAGSESRQPDEIKLFQL